MARLNFHRLWDAARKNPWLFFLALSFPLSLSRFINAILTGWNHFAGELLASFPFYFLLKNYNPALYESLGSGPWFPETWAYGPVHHFWLFPLTWLFTSVESFFRSLLILYTGLIIGVLCLLYNRIKQNKSYLFFFAYFSIALGSLGLVDNMVQRNIELLEFSLIVFAFLCLRRNREYSAGMLLSFAAMSKVYPIIFFPYLLAKRKFKAVFAFLITFIVIAVITQFTLDWSKYQLFQPSQLEAMGIPSLSSGFPSTVLENISQVRGSFYTFILTFFADIDMTQFVPEVTYRVKNFLVPNLIFFIFAVFILILSFYFFYKTGKRGDLLLEFSITPLVILLIHPHINPHYYIFTILALISIMKIFAYDLDRFRLSLLTRIFLFSIYVVTLLSLASIVPLIVYEKIFPLTNTAFHYFTTYSIFAPATFILWMILLWFYWNDYKTKEKECGIHSVSH